MDIIKLISKYAILFSALTGKKINNSIIVKIISFSLYYFSKLKIKDPTNGFRLFSKELIENFDKRINLIKNLQSIKILDTNKLMLKKIFE